MISRLRINLYIDGSGAGGQPNCIVKLECASDILSGFVTLIFWTGRYCR